VCVLAAAGVGYALYRRYIGGRAKLRSPFSRLDAELTAQEMAVTTPRFNERSDDARTQYSIE
jgi:hypothetical protein